MPTTMEGDCEVVSSAKASETNKLHQQGDKQVKNPRVSMDLQLFHRQKTMLISHLTSNMVTFAQNTFLQ